MESWEKLADESPKAYKLFLNYLGMGCIRSIAKVRQDIGKKPGYDRQLEKYSARYHWVKRAELFDKDIEKDTLEELCKKNIEMNLRHIESSMLMQQKSLERFRTLDLSSVSPSDAVKMFEAAVKLERIARGAPSDTIRQELTGIGGKAISIQSEYDFSVIDFEERCQLKNLLEKCRIAY